MSDLFYEDVRVPAGSHYDARSQAQADPDTDPEERDPEPAILPNREHRRRKAC